jgi:membrane protein implicated in regulation of membrane protease activity
MNLDSPETWRWIWMVTAVVFTVGEMATAGTFFFMPFALGAVAAVVAAFAGLDVALEWLVFVATSGAAFAVLFPLRRRLDRQGTGEWVGAHRWVGREAVVLAEIPGGAGAVGLIRLDREEWRAESGTGAPIRAGSTVLVTRVDGTRLVVLPLDEPSTTFIEQAPSGAEEESE